MPPGTANANRIMCQTNEEPAGGAVRTRLLSPQQATEPSLLTPQVCPHPALTETKEPAGGVARLNPLWPQQATEPSTFTPTSVPVSRADGGFGGTYEA